MNELSDQYMHLLAEQFIFISVFLGGFSATLLATIISSDLNNKCSKAMIVTSATSALSFVICVFCMTGIFLMTSEGYPNHLGGYSMSFTKNLAAINLAIGILSFVTTIGLSGWLKSRGLGITTSILATIAFVVLLIAM